MVSVHGYRPVIGIHSKSRKYVGAASLGIYKGLVILVRVACGSNMQGAGSAPTLLTTTSSALHTTVFEDCHSL